MAKAGMPVETASNVEKAYYGLLVAQRQLDIARANAGSFATSSCWRATPRCCQSVKKTTPKRPRRW